MSQQRRESTGVVINRITETSNNVTPYEDDVGNMYVRRENLIEMDSFFPSFDRGERFFRHYILAFTSRSKLTG